MGDFDRELAFALAAATKAGAIALGSFGQRPETKLKADGTWVSAADLATEADLRRSIAAAYPDHNILGEEEGLTGAAGGPPTDGAPTWVLDPIDGTNNYIADIPIWATLVGLRIGDESVVGVVHAPALGETYAAAAGSGASMNGRPIAVDSVTDLADAMVISAGYQRFEPGAEADFFLKVVRTARRDRGFGDFWGHMLVARGAASVMLEPGLAIWDVAALQPIVTEAGGRLTQLDGTPFIDGGSVLTTNGLLHEALVDLRRAER